MSNQKIKLGILVMLFGFVFQSCQKDEVLNDDLTENTVITRGDERNNNPRGGGGNNGNGNIENLDNSIVYQWTETILEVERYALGMRPNASARALAYINLAAYETAVPGMRDYESLERRLNGLDIRNPRGREINFEIALNACYAKVADHFLYNVTNNADDKITALEQELADELTNRASNRVVNDSEEWGQYVADQIIEYSQTDTEAEKQILEPQPRSYEPPTGPGFWTYSADPERALFPYWGSVRTFVISPDETTTVPPIQYSNDPNSAYFAQMKEVYDVNNTAKAQDNEDLWIAEFWSDDVEELMISPPARQFAIANQLVQQYDQTLGEALAFYVKLGFALNDAAVATWKYKYQHMVMRPNVYIHDYIDPDFQTNLFRLVYWPNPSFPGYPSGHSCFASAAGGVFIDVFGNQTNFTDRTHEGRTEFRGAPRTFTSFEQMAAENAFSRVPLGVHPEMDCTEGLRLGYEISDAVNRLRLN